MNLDYSKVISISHGNIALMEHLANESGVKSPFGEYFPDDAENILDFAYYEISEATLSHLFQYRLKNKTCQIHRGCIQIHGGYRCPFA